MAKQKKASTVSGSQIIVSVQLAKEAKGQLDKSCEERGMTIKSLLGRLIEWFGALDKTGQAVVLGQVDGQDSHTLADIVSARSSGAKPAKSAK